MSDLARPNGPGSHPLDQAASHLGGKAVSIPRADEIFSEVYVEDTIIGFFDLCQRHKRAGIPQYAVYASGKAAPEGYWLHPLTLYWLPNFYRDLPPAQGIEARQGRDEGSVHESWVAKGDAP